jgi:sulfonate dioxygenase
LRHAVDGNFEQ